MGAGEENEFRKRKVIAKHVSGLAEKVAHGQNLIPSPGQDVSLDARGSLHMRRLWTSGQREGWGRVGVPPEVLMATRKPRLRSGREFSRLSAERPC